MPISESFLFDSMVRCSIGPRSSETVIDLWDTWLTAYPTSNIWARLEQLANKIIADSLSETKMILLLDHYLAQCPDGPFPEQVRQAMASIVSAKFRKNAVDDKGAQVASILDILVGKFAVNWNIFELVPSDYYARLSLANICAYHFLEIASTFLPTFCMAKIVPMICEGTDLHYHQCLGPSGIDHHLVWSLVVLEPIQRNEPADEAIDHIRAFCLEGSPEIHCYLMVPLCDARTAFWDNQLSTPQRPPRVCCQSNPRDLVRMVRYGPNLEYQQELLLPIIVADVICDHFDSAARGDFRLERDRLRAFNEMNDRLGRNMLFGVDDEQISRWCEQGGFGIWRLDGYVTMAWTVDPPLFWLEELQTVKSADGQGDRHLIHFQIQDRGATTHWRVIGDLKKGWARASSTSPWKLTASDKQETTLIDGPIYYDGQEGLAQFPEQMIQTIAKIPRNKSARR